MDPIKVTIEAGQKRTFASAIDWPGWSRSGRDEDTALQALLEAGPRYAQTLQDTGLGFTTPTERSDFTITSRQEGNTSTDFGTPGAILPCEYAEVDPHELERMHTILRACWQAFDTIVRRAEGKNLRLGPRGGGRDLEKMMEHVLGAEQAYLGSLAWKRKKAADSDLPGRMRHVRQEALQALEAAAKGELPKQGPRGGKVWPLRYYVRRAAWHVLDHAWEIEDRVE